MSVAANVSPVPKEVRWAGILTILPGVAALGLAVLLLIEYFTRDQSAQINVFAEVGLYVVFALATFAVAIGLILGKLWARSPALVIALVVTGMGWYTVGPSARPEIGIPTMILGLAIIILLFRRPSRAWALGQLDDETEAEAAARGGIKGRAEQRERDNSN